MARLSRFAVPLLTVCGFFAGAALLYGRAISTAYVADDWEYLAAIDRAGGSPSVLFELLGGRFVRPLVVLLYYGGYSLFHLWAPPVHLALILVHAVNASMLSVLTVHIDSQHRRAVGLATGGLFLAFAGHSEAVTWIGGAADVFVAFWLLGMLLLAERARSSASPQIVFVASSLALLIAALLCKESAVVLPAIVAVYAWLRGTDRRHILVNLVAAGAVVVCFLGLRTVFYGPPTAAYDGLGVYAGGTFAHLRALLTRSFVPPSFALADAWVSGRDLLWFMVGVAAVASSFFRGHGRALTFCVTAVLIAVAPAWPLSVSLGTSESERILYVATLFASAITVFTLDGLIRRQAIAVTLVAFIVAANAMLLQQMNLRWAQAAQVFEGVTSSLVSLSRAHDPGADGQFFILSLPDDVLGAYVFRRGFLGALRFFGPEFGHRSAAFVVIESEVVRSADDRSDAARLSNSEYSLDVTPRIFMSVTPPARPFFDFTEWTRSRYSLRFSPTVKAGVVFHVYGTTARFLGAVTGPGAPFGVVDIPADNSLCHDTIRFSGWALDDREVTQVVALRQTTPDAAPTEIAVGTWARGTRPDVAAAYGNFPNTDRAEWDFEFQCSALQGAGDGTRILIVAHDADGHRTELGARRVRTAGPAGAPASRQ